MTDPIGTAQERELINYLCRSTASVEEEQAADALQSRIAEVERLRAALRSVLEWWPEGSETGRASEKYGSGFSEDIANARAALSQAVKR